MRKTTKFFVIIACLAVAAICVLAGLDATRQGEDVTETTTAAPVTVQPTTAEPTTQETTTAEAVIDLSEKLIGKWTDSAGMSGFEFYEDGKASFTYANLAALGISFDGTVDNGTYKLEGSTLTVTYSIYKSTIEKQYEISIEDDVLKMTNKEDNKTSSYVRSAKGDIQPGTTAPSVSDELYGSWENKSMSKSYKFAGGGKVTVTLDGEKFDGVYVTEGTDITIQYSAYSKQITEKFTFSVTTNALTLTNAAGSEFIFKRAGTSAAASADDDILGLWRDSANLSGYEFKEDGVVEITFVNIDIPIVNVPVNGTFTGAYEIEGSVLTLTYYIYGNAITNSYTYEISGNSLKLTNTEDSKISTYMKQ